MVYYYWEVIVIAIIYDTYCVYIHTTPSNKAYIGITCQKPEHRWNNGNGYKQHRYFYAAIQKYGWDNIHHEIFADNLTKDEACRMEEQLISLFQTTDRGFGYNLSTGGEIGTVGVKLTPERRLQIARYNTGRTKSPEEKERLRQAHLGKKLSESTKEKLRNINLGKHLSEETKRKIGDACRGRVYSNARPIYCVELNMIFPSSTRASEYVGHPNCGGNILKACKGEVKTCYGYHWRYYDNEEVG